MEINSILLAFLLTMIAGLSTGVGSLIAFFAKRTNTKFLSAALGFSAGVMIYISFMELMPEALGMLSESFSPRMSNIYMLIAFFSGTSFIALIDFLIPEDENPHEVHRVEELSGQQRLHRTGILMALAISIHNFPEGLATGVGFGTDDISNGVAIAFGIALQNMPEGLAVALSLVREDYSVKFSFLIALLTGLVEPIGAFLGYGLVLIFEPILPFILALAGGAMLFVISDEIIPETHSRGYERQATYGIIIGFIVMMILDILLG